MQEMSMIKNIFPKREAKLQKSDIYIWNDSRRVMIIWGIPRKGNPVRMVWYSY